MAEIAVLTAWLNKAIDALPTDKAQIVLNLDCNTVVAEIKTVVEVEEEEGVTQRTEVRTTSRLYIMRPRRAKSLAGKRN